MGPLLRGSGAPVLSVRLRRKCMTASSLQSQVPGEVRASFHAVALDGFPVDAEAETRLVVQVQLAGFQFRAVGVEAGPQRVALGIRERLDTEPIGDRGDQVAVD